MQYFTQRELMFFYSLFNFLKYPQKITPIVMMIFFNTLYADDPTLTTFGTLGFVHNNNDNYIYKKEFMQKDGSSGDVDTKTDSLIGLQVSYPLNSAFSFTLQGIGKYDYQDEPEGILDWGYLRFETKENLQFKLGRMRNPFYKNSDNRNIGYSTMMIREPVEIYGQVPFSSYNGGEFIYSGLLDTYFYTLQTGYGKEDVIVPIHTQGYNVDVNLKNLLTTNLTFGTPELQGRITYLQSDITASHPVIDSLFGTIRATDPVLADRYEYRNKKSKYLSFGVFGEFDHFFFGSEYGKRKSESFFADIHGFYCMVGYTSDHFSSYVSIASSAMDGITKHTNPYLNEILKTQNLAQKSRTIGAKYTLNKNIDFKIQYEQITPQGFNGSYHLNTLGEAQEKLDAISVALDFIF